MLTREMKKNDLNEKAGAGKKKKKRSTKLGRSNGEAFDLDPSRFRLRRRSRRCVTTMRTTCRSCSESLLALLTTRHALFRWLQGRGPFTPVGVASYKVLAALGTRGGTLFRCVLTEMFIAEFDLLA